MNQAEASTSNSNDHHQSPPPERSVKKELWRCLPLYRALLRGDDESEQIVLSIVTPHITNKVITGAGDTCLHVLAGARNWLELTDQESWLISELTCYGESLTARNRDSLTPLCVAATVGNMQAARKLLEQEKLLEPSVRALNEAVGPYPIIEAARYGHKEMVLLLIRDMERKMCGFPPTKESAVSLFLHLLVEAGFYDLLLALVRRNPGLARAEFCGDNNESLLSLMAKKPSAFWSGTQRSRTQRSFRQQLDHSGTHSNLQIRLADIEKSLVEVQFTAIDSPTSCWGLPPPNVSTWECSIKCLLDRFITILKWPARAIYGCMNYVDVLLDLVLLHPGLARAEFYGDNNESLLSLMAGKPSAFRSGIRLSFWQRLHYSVTPIGHIRDTKVMHEEALAIVKCLCEELMKHYYSEDIEPVLRTALLLAASSGTSEIIEEIIECYPDAIWFVNSENHNLFHLAVINRYEKVFNLIYQLSIYKHLVIADDDTSGNNILHMAGKLAPLGRLNLISGAALQMQRELQWFQEVEKFVHPTLRTKRNPYGKTPKMVFTEEHKELVKEGERWMKETANSCIFVSALTATVGFAAAITVPGGNNQNSGFPLFSNKTAFTIFAVSVAFCLFFSVASVILFLSILTSRYAEGDFLKSLPTRLILGLGTLCISMTSLVTAFGAAIYLVFGQTEGWMLVSVGIAALMPAGILALLPVIHFESLQIPLLIDMFMSTYGPSIFRKQSSRFLH